MKRFNPLKPDVPDDLAPMTFAHVRRKWAEDQRERDSQRRLARMVWTVLFCAGASLVYAAGLLVWWLCRHPRV